MGGKGGQVAGRMGQDKRWMAKRKVKLVMATKDREWAREKLEPHLDDFIVTLVADFNDRDCTGHRTAVSGVLELLGWIGPSDKLLDALLARIGASSEDELARGFERGKMASEADVSSVDRRGIDYFRRRMQAEPGFRRQLLWELFGVREVESQAQEDAQLGSVATNGHLNGSGLKPHDESP